MNYKCRECDSVGTVTADALTTVQDIVQGEELELTYYTCSNCGKQTLVQVDNKETLELWAEVKCLVTKKLARAVRNQQMPKKQLERMEKLDKQLNHIRKGLMSKYFVLLDQRGSIGVITTLDNANLTQKSRKIM